jgi:hypothetical protein
MHLVWLKRSDYAVAIGSEQNLMFFYAKEGDLWAEKTVISKDFASVPAITWAHSITQFRTFSVYTADNFIETRYRLPERFAKCNDLLADGICYVDNEANINSVALTNKAAAGDSTDCVANAYASPNYDRLDGDMCRCYIGFYPLYNSEDVTMSCEPCHTSCGDGSGNYCTGPDAEDCLWVISTTDLGLGNGIATVDTSRYSIDEADDKFAVLVIIAGKGRYY